MKLRLPLFLRKNHASTAFSLQTCRQNEDTNSGKEILIFLSRGELCRAKRKVRHRFSLLVIKRVFWLMNVPFNDKAHKRANTSSSITWLKL